MERIKLGEICEILNGYAFKSEYYVSSGIRVVRIANVQKGYIEDSDPAFYPEDCTGLEKYMLYENDLLMSLTGNVGRVALLDKEFLPAALNQRVACLRIKRDDILLEYVFHFLNSNLFEQRCIKAANGVAQKNMSTEWLKEYEIPVVPMEEQKKIVDILNQTKGIIDSRKYQLSKLDILIKARFVEMFGNENTNSEWKEWSIGELAKDARTGPFGSALHHDEFTDSGVFVLGIDNAVENKFSFNRMRYITEEKYLQLKRYTVFPGDVIITIMGTVGRSAVIPKNMPKAINTKHLACITPNNKLITANFLSCTFQIHPYIRAQLRSQTKGAIMDGLNLTIIKKLKLKLPPIGKQLEFDDFFIQVNKSKFMNTNIIMISRNLD